jgi:hypothetical protein
MQQSHSLTGVKKPHLHLEGKTRNGNLRTLRGLKFNGTKTYAQENGVALTVYKIDLETVLSTNIYKTIE